MTAPARSTNATRTGRRAPEQPQRRARKQAPPTDTTDVTGAVGTVDAPVKPSRTERTTGRPRTAAAERAYARRAQREGTRSHVTPSTTTADDAGSGRASFVVLVIALLAVGVAATLWLTTQAIADSFKLETAKQEATVLAEQAAQLQQEVTKQEAAPALAERARALGMVPAGDAPRLVVNPDGSVTVVGEPKPATVPPAPVDPVILPPAAGQPTAGQPVEGAAAAGVPAAGTPAGAAPAVGVPAAGAPAAEAPAGAAPAGGAASAGGTPAGASSPNAATPPPAGGGG
ncbi:hypothetical protein [Actinokineospora sp. NBRC 105648]|uniref:hypothetical protein n=1 Tax=Actinokineospora sp. NBRC 105648 TaxID=3032206 RepID=UPI0024A21D09|nr:hypothetical protein [Actinokineospora sp. NBRC 105648]GLZ42174.1 hypothetical protein Acsp05_57980 [Actinokineospora sp. NBRC 105648]